VLLQHLLHLIQSSQAIQDGIFDFLHAMSTIYLMSSQVSVMSHWYSFPQPPCLDLHSLTNLPLSDFKWNQISWAFSGSICITQRPNWVQILVFAIPLMLRHLFNPPFVLHTSWTSFPLQISCVKIYSQCSVALLLGYLCAGITQGWQQRLKKR